MKISIIIRTLNEEKHLKECLLSLKNQTIKADLETIVVDSGSTDRTLEICSRYAVCIIHMRKEEFSYGRALNIGCEASSGEILVFLSAHCVPQGSFWLEKLINPLIKKRAQYVYGAQRGRLGLNTICEYRDLLQAYAPKCKSDDDFFYVNNSNAAIMRDQWHKYRFDENLPGREDLHLAMHIYYNGGIVTYAPDSVVEHLHNEKWSQVKKRFYREFLVERNKLNVQLIPYSGSIPEMLMNMFKDFKLGFENSRVSVFEILSYRSAQNLGRYLASKRGGNEDCMRNTS